MLSLLKKLLIACLVVSSPVHAQVPALLKDIRVGTGNSNPGELTVIGNTVFFEANDSIDRKINEQRDQIKKALESNLDIAPFTDELKRLQDLKSSIASTIANLKNLLVIDVSGKFFDMGMAKVVDKIKNKK